MSDEEIMQTLEKFKEFLHVGNLFSDPFRWIGWVFVKGLAYILDGLEKVTDDVLLIKKFFQNAEVVAFVQTIRPFLYILLAFSLLYVGYLLVFQKKFDREGIAINLFIALIVLALLGTGMDKANEFTDEAITAIGSSQLYEEEEGSLSENILSRNIHDLVEFDVNGWSSTDLDRPNTIPLDMISGIGITEKFDSGRSELNMTSAGKDLSKKELIWVSTQKDLTKFDQSGVEWNNSYYYRYSLNWVTLLTTIIVMAFTLFSIAYKLARLSFELAFNYILAIIIAPADVHDGQKTKKIIQSILNTFLVIILIFLSMKVYMIGTAYLADQLNGLAYLIALIAFSVAVIDGPNIVERLFGIDAGLKNGWGVLAGAYAGGRMVAGLSKGVANMGKGNTDNKNKSLSAMSGGTDEGKAPSPNDAENESNKDKKKNGTGTAKLNANASDSLDENKSSSPNDAESETDESKQKESTGTTSSVSQQAEEQATGQRKQSKAPSPNDVEGISTTTGMGGASQSPSNAQTTSSSQSTETENVSDNATVRTDANLTGIQDSVQGNTTGSKTRTGGSGGSQAPTPTQPSGASNQQTTSSSQSTETANVSDNATVRTDANVTGIQESLQGNTTGSRTRTGGGGSPQTPTTTQPSGASNTQTTSSSQSTETAKVNNNSTVRTDTDVSNTVQEVAGGTSTSTSRTGGGATQAPTDRVNTGGTNTAKTTSGSHTTETSKVTSNSTVTTDTEVSNVIQETAATTTTRTDRTGSGSQNSRINQSNERKRPRNYPVDKGSSNVIDRMKNYKNK